MVEREGFKVFYVREVGKKIPRTPTPFKLVSSSHNPNSKVLRIRPFLLAWEFEDLPVLTKGINPSLQFDWRGIKGISFVNKQSTTCGCEGSFNRASAPLPKTTSTERLCTSPSTLSYSPSTLSSVLAPFDLQAPIFPPVWQIAFFHEMAIYMAPYKKEKKGTPFRSSMVEQLLEFLFSIP
jgi:hypothetical protein